MKDRLQAYYSLTKPGVLYGNVLTVIAGFLYASGRNIDIGLMFATLAGSTFVIASACVINNYFDRDIDLKMDRTKHRAIVSGKVPPRHALSFGIFLGLLGIGILAAYTNTLVVSLGVMGFIIYVFLYAMLSKRLSWHGTLVGSISGAIPILTGYVAVGGELDTNALLLFAALFFWQMPEFYSIAIYRRTEYEAADVPVISVAKGIPFTIRMIYIYTIAFVVAVLLLGIIGSAGLTYLAVTCALSIYWLWLGLDGFINAEKDRWAKRMFRFSLIYLLAYCLLISVETWLP